MTKILKSLSILTALVLALSLAIVALPMASPAEASPGTPYYVDVATGLDTNGGTSWADAWKTIGHAADTVPAGTSPADPNVIHVKDGTYTTPNETFPITFDEKNVTLLADYTTTAPTIDGGATTTILKIEDTGITIDGFTIEDATKGIEADVGGFSILDNTFSDVDYGVYFYISETDFAADYTVDDILIQGNTFNASNTGVYVSIDLDYDSTVTGKSVTIGGIDIMDNTFNMAATTGIDIDIKVNDLTGGSVSMGDVDISDGNEFYGGSYGIDFEGYFNNLTDTTVTVGDVIITGNTFQNQTSYAMNIDYYNAEYWHGTTTGTYGDLVINDNNITSTTTDAIYIDTFGDFEYFYNYSALTVGNLYIQGNQIDVSGYGIYLYYYYVGYYMYDSSQVTTGEVHIGGTGANEGNTIDAGSEAIYIEYDYVACEMNEDTTPCEAALYMGDIYIQENSISGTDDGIYMYYYDYEVGYYMCDDAYAELARLCHNRKHL